jgi:type II secretory pathway pseudopilin PulG
MTIRTDNDVLRVQRDRHGKLRSVKGSGLALPDRRAFTLAEMLMVVVILIIAALAIIPSAGSAAAQAAADIVAADLEYAKSMAVSRGQSYSVAFYIDEEKYEVKDPDDAIIGHPIKPGNYVVNFAQDSRLAGVEIESVDFDSTSEIVFDYLGSPHAAGAADGADLVDTGVVKLTCGSVKWKISIERVTGVITKSNYN